jgi:hypothetical protein
VIAVFLCQKNLVVTVSFVVKAGRHRRQASSHKVMRHFKIYAEPVGAGLPAMNDDAVIQDEDCGSTRSNARFTANSASMMIC